MTEEELRALLRERESETLDFKRTAYRIRGGDEKQNEKQKAELIKDVMAFANAWRDSPAHILLGVDDSQVPARVVGIPSGDHVDDATLQQLVNSKFNRPVRFGYERLLIDGLHVGVVSIAPHLERPFFLVRSFEGLQQDTVYLRRGSSTDVARPDEVARMGKAHGAPPQAEIRLEFANGPTRELLGTSVHARLSHLVWPAKGTPEDDALKNAIAREWTGDYYDPSISGRRMSRIERLFLQHREQRRMVRVSMALVNDSHFVVNDVCASFFIESGQGVDVPKAQFRDERGMANMLFAYGCGVEERPGGWQVTQVAKKIQARDTGGVPEGFLLSVNRSCTVLLKVRLSADELSGPISQELAMKFELAPEVFTEPSVKPR